MIGLVTEGGEEEEEEEGKSHCKVGTRWVRQQNRFGGDDQVDVLYVCMYGSPIVQNFRRLTISNLEVAFTVISSSAIPVQLNVK